MTQKRFRKLLRAHYTAYYIQHKNELSDWIGEAYRSASKSTAGNYANALAVIQKALPLA